MSGHKAMGGHHSADSNTDEWLTPPSILQKLPEFDLDPCSPINRPWDTAKKHFTVEDDGLNQDWNGRVWCNPPYGLEAALWLRKMKQHGNGIALIFARTETKMFFDHVWNGASALLFIEGRLCFHLVNAPNHEHCESNSHEWHIYNPKTNAKACKHCGQAKTNSGAPSVLVSYGKNNAEVLLNCGIKGKFISLTHSQSNP